MKREYLAEHIRTVALLQGDFTLRSGIKSSFYFDKYRFESDPKILAAIAEQMQELLPESYDRIAGLELGGIPIATVLSQLTGRPCLYVRKAAKSYGTRNLVEGSFNKGDRVIVIEDVITTAGQVCKSVVEMREAGLEVNHVVCAVDREQGGKESLNSIGCLLSSLFKSNDLGIGT